MRFRDFLIESESGIKDLLHQKNSDDFNIGPASVKGNIEISVPGKGKQWEVETVMLHKKKGLNYRIIWPKAEKIKTKGQLYTSDTLLQYILKNS